MTYILYIGFFGLLFVIKLYADASCNTERNPIKDKDETSCVQMGLKSVPLNEIPIDTAILILKFNSFKYIITSSLKGLPNLVELDLSDNALSSFQVDYPLTLEELNLANNSIKSVPKLSQLSQLTHLVLANNRISTISENTFTGLKDLKSLELQKNHIDSLHEEAFKDTPLLDHLDLSYNRLWTVSEGLVSNLARLEKFYLTGNRLTEIPDGFFDGLDNLAYVYLDQNPWNCNCALVYFKNWLVDNDISVYHIVDGSPDNDVESVACSDGTALVNYDTDHCFNKAKGDRDDNSMSKLTQKPLTVAGVTTVDPTTEEPTQEPRVTTLVATTAVTTRPTPVATTTALETTTTELAKVEETTTPVLEPTTRPSVEATSTSIDRRTSERTTQVPTTTASQTILATTSEASISTQVTTPTFHSTPKKEEPSTLLMSTLTVTTSHKNVSTVTSFRSTPKKDEPSTFLTSTLITSHVSTGTSSTTLLGESTGMTDFPPYSMPPARGSQAAAVGMLWQLHAILNHCCILHLFLYVFCLLLVLMQMLVYVMVLLWTRRFFSSHYKVLKEMPDDIRLIRYSLRSPENKEEVLLVHNDTIEPHFREQSSNGVTQMLVLELSSRDPDIRCTSVIL